MRVVTQTLGEILASLRPLDVDWRDETSERAVEALHAFPVKAGYGPGDIRAILNTDFDTGLLLSRLFLGLSKDQLETALAAKLGPGGIGVKRFHKEPTAFIDALIGLGLIEAFQDLVHRRVEWSDLLIERLRSSRGRAVSGQKRARDLEDFVEAIVRRVFDDQLALRCSFIGAGGVEAKCDVVIPSRLAPRIIIEAKAYNATGSKMSDVIGDLTAITRTKRQDSAFLFVTDGVTWQARKSDLEKIIQMQNRGDISRIYTTRMADQLEEDLRTLKSEYGL
jgi:DpnII restriction endonuclease